VVKRFQFMDILRSIAVFLVMWSHFISVGTFAKTLPGIISEDTYLPILNQNHGLWKFDSWLLTNLHTEPAIVGVLLFFLITGYLISSMQERYSRLNFLINRFFRIFPTLIICIIITGIFLYFNQGIVFKPINYIGSITLLYNLLFLVPPIIGVLWTLVIEVLFYIISAFVKKFDFYKLIALYMFIFITVILCSKYENNYSIGLAYNVRFLSFILIGTTIYLSESIKNVFNKILLVSSSAIFALATFQIYSLLFHDQTAYSSIGTHVLALIIFITFYIIQMRWSNNVFQYIPKTLLRTSDLVYPVYLTHTVFGLVTMYLLAREGINQYLIICGGVIISFIIAAIVHILVEKPSISLGKSIIKKIDTRISSSQN
jgi:peptidoglycan/LPS O-acetylase OafA/YrhL